MSTPANTDPSNEASGKKRGDSSPRRRGWIVGGVILLLLVLAGQLAYSVSQESLTWDEGDHVFAGYMSWKHADFGLNPEHPPLAKMVATIPLLLMKLQVPKLQNRFFKHEANFGGRDLIYGNDAAKIIFCARMAAMIFTLLLALFVFLAAREMFGTGAALAALILFVFEPNILAHGALVTTDMSIACLMFATFYVFYRYVKKPTIPRLLIVGCAAGLGLAAKHSGIFVFPILLLLAVTEVVRGPQIPTEPANRAGSRGQQALRMATALVVVGVIAVAILWSSYGFRFQMRPVGLNVSPTLTEFVGQLKNPAERRTILALARWRLLPEAYLYGLVDVQVVADATPSYLFGKVYRQGQWFYFPALFVIKSTLPVILLLLLLPLALALRRVQCWREILFLAVPPALYFVVAMFSGLNIGVRHILPIYPFVVVLAAVAAWTLVRADRRWIYLVGTFLLFHVLSSVRAFPVSYIPYSNELWGGPPATYKYLTDSNTDWGQQLIGTKKYLDRRGVKNCWFAYFVEPGIRFSSYGIPCKPLPTPDTNWYGEQIDTPPVIEGPVLISASDLTGYEFGSNVLNPYRDFQKLRPSAVIEHGVFVFDGTFNVPLASALGHVQRSRALLNRKQLDEALVEAQAAAALAPDTMQPQMVLGDILTAMHRDAEARPVYEKALAIAKTMEPSAQEGWIPAIQQKLSAR